MMSMLLSCFLIKCFMSQKLLKMNSGRIRNVQLINIFHHENRVYYPDNYLHNSSSLRPTYKDTRLAL